MVGEKPHESGAEQATGKISPQRTFLARNIDIGVFLLICLYCLTALWGILQAVAPENGAMYVLLSFTFVYCATTWTVVDSRRRGRVLLHIVQFLMFFTWPITVPAYLIYTRRLRGLAVCIIHFIALAVTWNVAFITSLLVLYDPDAFGAGAEQAPATAQAASDTKNSADNEAPRVRQHPGQSALVRVGSEDQEMQAAIEKAQETLPTFLNTLQDHWPSQHGFQIKVEFKQKDEAELMWLSDVTYDGRVLKGKLNSDPEINRGIKRGDVHTVAPQDVVDWTYDEYGRTIGGFTQRVVISRLPRQQQLTQMRFAEPVVRRTVSFDSGRGRIEVPEVFETGVNSENGKRWIAPRGKSATISVYVSFLQEEPRPVPENFGHQYLRAEAEKLGREVGRLGDKSTLHVRAREEVNGKQVINDTYLVGWADHVATFSAQTVEEQSMQSIDEELLLGIMDMIHSLTFVEDDAKPKGSKPVGSEKRLPHAEAAETEGQTSNTPMDMGPIEIIGQSGATRIFQKVPGNKARRASARVRIPEDLQIDEARISGEGHNQDRAGYARTMEVTINGRLFKVIPLIPNGQTKSFDMALPSGVLVNGWNDVEAYIEWSNETYDRGHWVSLTLNLEVTPERRQSKQREASEQSNQGANHENEAALDAVIADFTAATPKETVAAQEECAQRLGLPIEITNSIGMRLKLVPPGEFMMGSAKSPQDIVLFFGLDKFWIKQLSDEHPQHRVRITKPFYLGIHEVTLGEFRKYVEATGYKTDAEKASKGSGWNESEGKMDVSSKYNWLNTGFVQADNHPVVNVSWNDAVAFCRWLSREEGHTHRLPTEAEWEYACRAGTTTMYYNGDDPEGLAHCSNTADATFKMKMGKYQEYKLWRYIEADDGHVFTSPVGKFRPNLFGFYDMHGNVWEWCADWYDAEYYARSPTNDPTGPDKGRDRVWRGGSWVSYARVCRAASRNRFEPQRGFDALGFRVVAIPSQE